ncbi:hypothetical protein D083_2509 [Dickeya solani RNS 08.23.3.1.A]|nr:hypothetical protein D083_2509 [Dickeya solani RNS 08.23.3.1.A]
MSEHGWGKAAANGFRITQILPGWVNSDYCIFQPRIGSETYFSLKNM